MFLRWLYKMLTYKRTQCVGPDCARDCGLSMAAAKPDRPSRVQSAFMLKYRSDGAGATFRVQQVNDEYDPDNPDKEASLGVQYTEGIAYPTPIIFYGTSRAPGAERSERFLPWLGYILDQDDFPQTISTSYGYFEGICNKRVRLVCSARSAWRQRPIPERER
jgi:hypothetical protein